MTDNGTKGVSTILNGARPESRRLAGAMQSGTSNLADLLERVLDKGIVIAGDVTLCLGEIELLQIKIRLLIASVDKAREMGIDWWQHDPALSSCAHKTVKDRDQVMQRLDRLETLLAPLVPATSLQEPNDAVRLPLSDSERGAAAGVCENPVPESHCASGR